MSGAVEKYDKRAEKVDSLVCVGLDSDFDKLPQRFKKEAAPQFEFNKWIIDQTHEFVSAYKPNIAFYEARGDRGLRELKITMEYLKERYADIFTVCDAKRAEVRNTSLQYVKEIFDWFGFDAVTLNPYLGRDALQPFLDYKDKACIILCKTSNPGGGEFQDLLIDGKPLWQVVAEKVVAEWNENKNCMLVAGATYSEELKKIRQIAGDMTLLVPGIGAQSGDLKSVVQAGLNSQGQGLILNSSRGIIFSENPKEAARSLRDAVNSFRKGGSRSSAFFK
ncbi:MAG: orotidine-5'-phosphate decarboxylase [Parcubacteria group bacterium Gr01-1014_30]|nr:MAG: orotidine-5'-phosphate decarboxylase [Parcubacteria group bacterium Gr01-1014_30]